MNSEEIKCNRCGIKLLSQNKYLHDIHCSGEIRSNHVNENVISLVNDDIIMKDDNDFEINKNKNIVEDEFWLCNQCDNYFDIREKQDHMISHQFEENLNDLNDLNELNDNGIDEGVIHTNINTNHLINTNTNTNNNNNRVRINRNTNSKIL
jgi:hypothetical protein